MSDHSDPAEATTAARHSARGPKDSVIEHQVDARPRDEHRQALQEGDRVESQMSGAVRPSMPQRQPDLPVRVDAQPRLRQEGRNV